MRRNSLKDAKLVVTVSSDKLTKKIVTEKVLDNRTHQFWSKEQIDERGITTFLNLDDLKETLNWNTNGDSSKYQFCWLESGRYSSTGIACVFD